MRKLMLFALVTLAAPAYALPPGVPHHFSGMAYVGNGIDQACNGTAAFMFETLDPAGRSWRVVLTTPPCFSEPFKSIETVVAQPTSIGSLWFYVTRKDDPGNDDGPLLHLTAGSPADQAAMAWRPAEIGTVRLRGRRLSPSHYEIRFSAWP